MDIGNRFIWGYSSHNLGSGIKHCFGMKRALLSGYTLNNDM
jgi:hypothetical protein